MVKRYDDRNLYRGRQFSDRFFLVCEPRLCGNDHHQPPDDQRNAYAVLCFWQYDRHHSNRCRCVHLLDAAFVPGCADSERNLRPLHDLLHDLCWRDTDRLFNCHLDAERTVHSRTDNLQRYRVRSHHRHRFAVRRLCPHPLKAVGHHFCGGDPGKHHLVLPSP